MNVVTKEGHDFAAVCSILVNLLQELIRGPADIHQDLMMDRIRVVIAICDCIELVDVFTCHCL